MKKTVILNSPYRLKAICRDMAAGLGFDGGQKTIIPPLDLLSYATWLGMKNYDVKFIDCQAEHLTDEDIIYEISTFKPDFIIISLSLPTLEADISFSRFLKDNLKKNTPIIIKTAIHYRPIIEKILNESECSFCIIGECDTIVNLLLEGNSFKGTARMLNGEYYVEDEIFLDNLDELPVLNRSYLKNNIYSYSRLGSNITTMQTSRGCPFRCAYYCPYPLVQGKKWRSMSAQRILKELQDITRRDIKSILFRDAVFTFDQERIKTMCKLIIKNHLHISWWCETRIDCLSEELIDLMKQAGCSGMNVGVETGDEHLLSSKAKPNLELSDIKRLSGYCKNTGMKLHFLLMIGFPGETKETLFKTFKLVKELSPESLGITTLTPYPGSQLYEDALQNNWIIQDEFSSFGGRDYNMKTGFLSKEDIQFAIDNIHAICRVANKTDRNSIKLSLELFQKFENWVINEQKINE